MVRSTPSPRRSKAAYAELSTPFRLKVGAVLMKRQGDRKRVPKGLIAELAAAYGCNSRSIRRIGAAFQTQILGPGLFDLHRHRQGNCGRPPNPVDKVREKVMAITPTNCGQSVRYPGGTGVAKSILIRYLRGLGEGRMVS